MSRAQLQGAGISAAAVDVWVRRARLQRLHRGVYAVGHTALVPQGWRLAAVLACGPGAVLSHVSAAAHWGLLHTAAALIDVTAPASRRGVAKVRLHRSRSLDARDVTAHEGVAITTVARTLLDVAGTLTAARLERAVAQAMHLRLYDHGAITDLIARSNGNRGRRALAAATARDDPSWTRNDLEARFLGLVRDAGLPEPLVNEPFEAPGHGRCEPDFRWPSRRLVVETDGWETHGTRAAFEMDRSKDAALTAAGYRVMRFTPRDVRERPETVLARLRAVLRYSAASASRNAASSPSSIE